MPRNVTLLEAEDAKVAAYGCLFADGFRRIDFTLFCSGNGLRLRSNPVRRAGMALVMRVVAFAPLCALLLFPAGSHWRWLAVLCPVLLIFFILPLRFSFAQALVQVGKERRFSFDRATAVQHYGEKLAESLLHVLHIVLWSIPLLALLGVVYYGLSQMGFDKAFTAVDTIGYTVTAVLAAVGNFFIGIFGGTAIVPNGSIAEGLTTLLVAVGIGLLILAWGVMRNSAYRYIWAYATQVDKNPHTEARRRLYGRRWKQFWTAMLNLVLWAPALIVLFVTFRGMFSDITKALTTAIITGQVNLPDLSTALLPMIFAFFVCYLPLLPVRRIITSLFATRTMRRATARTAASSVPSPDEDPSYARVVSSDRYKMPNKSLARSADRKSQAFGTVLADKRTLTPMQKGWQAFGKRFMQLLAMSLAAQAGVLLPTAAYFHQLPTYGILFNLVAVPLAGLLVPLFAAVLLVSLLPWVGSMPDTIRSLLSTRTLAPSCQSGKGFNASR